MGSEMCIRDRDIYRAKLATGRSEKHYVTVGRLTAFAAMLIALILAKPLLGDMEGAFQKIQEWTGFVAPGIVAVFLMGMFYKRTNSAGAFAMLFTSIIVSIIFYTAFDSFPFVNRIWVIFLGCLAIGALVSHLTAEPAEGQPVILGDINFKTSASFNVWTVIIAIILIALYAVFW